jgi:biotin synthase
LVDKYKKKFYILAMEYSRTFEEKVLSGEGLSKEEAELLLPIKDEDILDILLLANTTRQKFKGNEVSLCSIINAKSGMCGEDCAFCSQSAYHKTDAPIYPFMGKEKILERAKEAMEMQAREFSIVISGYSPDSEIELIAIENSIACIAKETNLEPCASLGILSEDELIKLKNAGLKNYHHNLETARSFYNNICSTHSYDEDLETVKAAKQLGFNVCCGGIFGMGESWSQRIELAFTLKELDVDSIPINFLNPIPGTRLEKARFLTPLECLKIISVFRLIMPKKDIFVCGGREVNLRDLQSMLFFAGANGMMIGGYLTTSGRKPEEDLRMIYDLGLKIKPPPKR